MTKYTKQCLGKCGKSAHFTDEDSQKDRSLPYKVYVCDNCQRKFSLQPIIHDLHLNGHILYDYVLQKTNHQ